MKGSFNAVENSDYSKDNKEALNEMALELLAGGDVGRHRIATVLSRFSSMDHLIDFDLKTADRRDLVELCRDINAGRSSEKEDLSVWTIAEDKKALKTFYRWYYKTDDPDIMDFASVHPRNSEKPRVQRDELLSPRDAEKFFNACSNPRDEVLVALLWDTGARISELLQIEWRDISFRNDTMKVYIRNGKNGSRTLHLVESIPVVKKWKTWKSRHTSIDGGDPVLSNYRPYDSTSQLSYRNAKKQIDDLAERVDLDDRILTNPHAWRKARATDLASKGVSQPNLNMWFGWSPGSDCSKWYIILGSRDLEKQVRELYPGLDPLPDSGHEYFGENIDLYDQADLRKYTD